MQDFSRARKIKVIFVLWFHIFLWILINTGVVLAVLNVFDVYRTTKIIYIISLAIIGFVTLSWPLFNNRCIITTSFNKIINISYDYGFRTPTMTLNGEQSELIQDNLSGKISDYTIKIIIIILLIYILCKKRWK